MNSIEVILDPLFVMNIQITIREKSDQLSKVPGKNTIETARDIGNVWIPSYARLPTKECHLQQKIT